MHVESKLLELGLALPAPIIIPPGARLPFAFATRLFLRFLRRLPRRAADHLMGALWVIAEPGPDGAGDHAREGATWLTGVHPKKTEGVGIHAGISADQIAAREFGKYTQLASLEVALESSEVVGSCEAAYSCAYFNTISWRDESTPLPMEINPRVAFERLFGRAGTAVRPPRDHDARPRPPVHRHVAIARIGDGDGLDGDAPEVDPADRFDGGLDHVVGSD